MLGAKLRLPKLEVPDSITYAAAFVSLKCNLSCVYCLNDPKQAGSRNELFPLVDDHIGLSPEQWIEGLSRFPKREDLPFTICGGEPTIYDKGNGLNKIVNECDLYFDLLTNMASMKFFKNIGGNVWKFQRGSNYPSIRVSWHQAEMEKCWKKGFSELVKRCESIKEYGFDVSDNIKESDIVIQMVSHPCNNKPDDTLWKGRVPFETKDFLGIHEGQLFGQYAYEHATSLVDLGIHDKTLQCDCLTREILVDQAGFIHRCHSFLYDAWAGASLEKEFQQLAAKDFRFVKFGDAIFADSPIKPLGHILDVDLDLRVLGEPKVCYNFGRCAFCDCKSKRKHYKKGEQQNHNYSSVTISNIQWPEHLK
jgi:organic radical activating enzyme